MHNSSLHFNLHCTELTSGHYSVESCKLTNRCNSLLRNTWTLQLTWPCNHARREVVVILHELFLVYFSYDTVIGNLTENCTYYCSGLFVNCELVFQDTPCVICKYYRDNGIMVCIPNVQLYFFSPLHFQVTWD